MACLYFLYKERKGSGERGNALQAQTIIAQARYTSWLEWRDAKHENIVAFICRRFNGPTSSISTELVQTNQAA